MTSARKSRNRNKTQAVSRTLAMGALIACLFFGGLTPVQAAEAASRQQAIDIALRQNGGNGKVLGVQTQRTSDGQTVFAVKVLSEGRVRVFRIRQAR